MVWVCVDLLLDFDFFELELMLCLGILVGLGVARFDFVKWGCGILCD